MMIIAAAVAPVDVVIEIMERLPVKSLMRFMALSKQWKSIIQSSRFIGDHNRKTHIHPARHFFVGYKYTKCIDIFNDDMRFLNRLDVPVPAYARRFKFMGYSQGLFGLIGISKGQRVSVVIWNPSIGKSVCKSVPDHGFTKFGFTVCNATDPTIIMITRFDCNDRWQLTIYKLSTGDWRGVSDAPHKPYCLGPMRIVMGRFIYWIAYDNRTTPKDYLILSFDITSEQFTELCLPPTLATYTSSSTLQLSDHRDSLVVLEEDVSKKEIGVWMLMEPSVHNSFTKLYTVKTQYKTEFPNILGFRKNGQLIFHHKDGKKVLFYDPDLKNFNDSEILGYGSIAGTYVETLLLLDYDIHLFGDKDDG